MNILAVGNTCLKGGVPRQLVTVRAALADEDIRYIYAFNRYEGNPGLSGSPVYDIPNADTVTGLIELVNQLVAIVQSERIDVIHIHSFNVVFGAMIASQLACVPTVLHIHGYASLTFPRSFVEEGLLRYFIAGMNPSVVIVSEKYRSYCAQLGARDIRYIPNTLNPNGYPVALPGKDRKWLYIGRLDGDKVNGLLELLTHMAALEISQLDIAGDGNCVQMIQDQIRRLGLCGQVNLLGSVDDISLQIKQGYEGVAGLGQVVLEGLMSGLPVLMAGYGRLSGLVDSKMYELIRLSNFVNTELSDCSVDQIVQQIRNFREGDCEKYVFPELVREHYGSKSVIPLYLNLYQSALFKKDSFILEYFDHLKEAVSQDEVLGESQLSRSDIAAHLLYDTLGPYLLDAPLRSMFIDYYERRVMEHKFNAKISTVVELNRSAISQVHDAINVKTLWMQTLSLLKRRFSK